MALLWVLYDVIEIRICLKVYSSDVKKKQPKQHIFKLSKRCNMGNNYNAHQAHNDRVWHFQAKPVSIVTDVKVQPLERDKTWKPTARGDLIRSFFLEEGLNDIKTLWFWLSAQRQDSLKYIPVPIEINDNNKHGVEMHGNAQYKMHGLSRTRCTSSSAMQK